MVVSFVILLAPMVVRYVMLVAGTIEWIVIVQRMNVHKYARKRSCRRCHSHADGRHHSESRAHSPHERNVSKPFDFTRQQHRGPM
jgi:hypothetical protein